MISSILWLRFFLNIYCLIIFREWTSGFFVVKVTEVILIIKGSHNWICLKLALSLLWTNWLAAYLRPSWYQISTLIWNKFIILAFSDINRALEFWNMINSGCKLDSIANRFGTIWILWTTNNSLLRPMTFIYFQVNSWSWFGMSHLEFLF